MYKNARTPESVIGTGMLEYHERRQIIAVSLSRMRRSGKGYEWNEERRRWKVEEWIGLIGR